MRPTIALMRGRDDAERSAARLAELGYVSVIAPLTRLVATGAVAPPGPYDAIVATSAKALNLLSDATRDAVAGVPLFVVGERSASAAAARGLAVEGASAVDVADLTQRLRARLATAARVLYLAGRDRRSELEQALAAAGREVTAVEIYAAEARGGWSEAESRALAVADAALHYSTRGAELASRFAERAGIGEEFRGRLHVCISEAAAAPLRAIGARRVRAAAMPREDALFSALTLALPGDLTAP